MRLAHPWSALLDDAAALAARDRPAFELPPLSVEPHSAAFLALRETAPPAPR